MSKGDNKSSDSRQRINDAVDDGGGCVEAWSSLSEMRKKDENSRRDFLRKVGVTLGAIPLGASATASADTAEEKTNSEQEVTVEEIQGKKRDKLVKEANSSEKVQFVANHLGKRGDVESVFKYTLENGETGYGVTYGTSTTSKGHTIQWYKSESFPDGTSATGSQPSGDGVITVDADSQSVLHIHGTSLQKQAISALQNNSEYKAYKQQLSNEELLTSDSIVALDLSGSQTRTQIIIPVQQDSTIVARLSVAGSGKPTTENVSSYSVHEETNGQVSVQFSIGFDPCAALCGALSGLSGAACASACDATVVGIPISPGCAAVCAGVMAGTCMPTCKKNT